jgi:hypothetical protein
VRFGQENLALDSWCRKKQYDAFCQVSSFTFIKLEILKLASVVSHVQHSVDDSFSVV